jgi:processive 1,2-diacylglycerol beta-glucosyltransferase
MKKQVLILTELFGNGHTNTAKALMEGMSHLAPAVYTQILEVGKVLHSFTSNLIINFYLKMIVHYSIGKNISSIS